MKDYTLPVLMKELWINGLMNPEYEQIDGCFYSLGEGHCALGVAMVECLGIDEDMLEGCLTTSDIVEKNKVPINDLMLPWKYNSHNSPKCREDEESGNGLHELEDVVVHMNDESRMSFKEIAVWIDANVEGV